MALPCEHLRALGFPDGLALEGLTDSHLKSLAGDAMAVPCVTMVMLCLIYGMSKTGL